VLVIQVASLGMEQRKTMIVGVLQRIFAPRAWVERSDTSFRRFEGMEDAKGILAGELNAPFPVKMNGLQFEVDVQSGHKTACISINRPITSA